MGLLRGSIFHIFRRDNSLARKRASATGHEQHKLGKNPFQLGGSFVFGPGNVDLYMHVSQTFGDNAPTADLLAASVRGGEHRCGTSMKILCPSKANKRGGYGELSNNSPQYPRWHRSRLNTQETRQPKQSFDLQLRQISCQISQSMLRTPMKLRAIPSAATLPLSPLKRRRFTLSLVAISTLWRHGCIANDNEVWR